jgi:uncharacterized protein YcaQ
VTSKQEQRKAIDCRRIAAFRLSRHHLMQRNSTDLVSVSRSVCGIQAQFMPAAEMALWARARDFSRSAISSALWQERTLVRTSCMRQTLHLIPAADFLLFIRALERSRFAAVMRIMSRFGIKAADVDGLNQTILDALDAVPLTQRELGEIIKSTAGKNVRKWMARVWSPLRTAVVKGLICYGPNRGREATFVRLDRWLPEQQDVDEMEAKQILLRRYLGAYGPATRQDFSKWSGIPVGEAAPVWHSLAGELAEIDLGGEKRFLLREDRRELADADFAKPVLRLLPAFDPYLLGHASKGHLLDDRHYKRVYRNQWWISPVILLDGRIIGTWSYTRKSRGLQLEFGFFEKVPKVPDTLIEREAASLGAFLEMPVEVKR